MINKIVSGGQTGADRAALDWAIENGIPHGVWCLRGRLAEDGPIATRYNQTETPSTDYRERPEVPAGLAMHPFLQNERKSLLGGRPVSHDVLICWLAYKEARALIERPSTPVAETSVPR